MKRRLLSGLLSILMVLQLLSPTVVSAYADADTGTMEDSMDMGFAEDMEGDVELPDWDTPESTEPLADSGTCGPSANWQVSDGTLYISGTGAITVSSLTRWRAEDVKKLVIQEGITSIGRNTFSACDYLEYIEIPDSVISIEYQAFDSCDRLKEVILPDSVQTIDSCAFRFCYDLETLVLPDGLETIPDYCFFRCESLKSVTIPESVMTIDPTAFEMCADFTVRCYCSSTAQFWADENGYSMEILDQINSLNLMAVAGPKGVTLSWSAYALEDIDTYIIYRSENKGQFEVLAEDVGQEATFLDTTVTGGASYTYRVFPVFEIGKDTFAEVSCVAVNVSEPAEPEVEPTEPEPETTEPETEPTEPETEPTEPETEPTEPETESTEPTDTVPPVVKSLTAKRLTELSEILPLLEFTVNAFDDVKMDCVEVSYSADGVTFQLIERLNYSSPSTSILMSSASSRWNLQYISTDQYILRAVAYDKAGNQSEPFDITLDIDLTPPPVPEGFQIASSGGFIQLYWDPSPEEGTQINVWRSAAGGSYSKIAVVTPGNNYQDTNVQAGIVYRYYLTAVDSQGNISNQTEILEGSITANKPPVINSLTATRSTVVFVDTITCAVTASDDDKVDRVEFSYSADGNVFHLIDTVDYLSTLLGVPLTNCRWNIQNIPSGQYILRAIAYDSSDVMSEPFDIIVDVDTTPPPVPTGFMVNSTNTSIFLNWDTSPEEGTKVEIHRSGDEYTNLLVATVTGGESYEDTSAKPDILYHYWLVAKDADGNTSEKTEVIHASLDTSPPIIVSTLPDNNASLCREAVLTASVMDDHALEKVLFSYRTVSTDPWTEIAVVEADTDATEAELSHTWTIPEGLSGNIQLKTTVFDVAGNQTKIQKIAKVLAYSAPVAPETTVQTGSSNALLQWDYDDTLADVLKYYIIWKTDCTGEHRTEVAKVSRNDAEYSVPLSEEKSYYIIETVDCFNNSAFSQVITVAPVTDTQAPVAKIRKDVQELGALGHQILFYGEDSHDNDSIAAWSWDFDGDGEEDSSEMNPGFIFNRAGIYTISLTVTDPSGNANTADTTLQIVDVSNSDSGYQLVKVTIVNAYDQNLSAIEGAKVLLHSGEYETYGTTGGDGSVLLIAPLGKCTIAAAAAGFSSASRTLTIQYSFSGQQCSIGLMPTNISLMDGSLTVKEMTIEEIKEAGIDINAEDNQHIYKFENTLTFTPLPSLPGMTVKPIRYVDDNNVIRGFKNVWYEYVYDEQGPTPTVIVRPEREDPAEEPDTTPETPDNPAPVPDIDVKPGVKKWEIGIFPISEQYVLVVYGESHWLKEMFNVELFVINNSYADPIEDCVAKLSLPNGLSLADMTGTPQTESISLGTISPNGSESGNTALARWYVRGDKEGSYSLSAKVTGMIGETPFANTFTADSVVKVYAGKALEMTITADCVAFQDEDYHVNYRLENVSDRTLYNLSFQIDKTEVKTKNIVFSRSNDSINTVYKVIQVNELGEEGRVYVDSLAPGEVISADLFCQPPFKSALELFEIGPMEIAYYLTDMVCITAGDSTTEVPVNLKVQPVTHGSLLKSIASESLSGAVDVLLEYLNLGAIGTVIDTIEILKFASEKCNPEDADPYLTIIMSKGQGSFLSPTQTYALASTEPVSEGAILISTNASPENCVIEEFDDYSTMTIMDDAEIYIKGVAAGTAELTMKTWTYYDNYSINEQTGAMEVVREKRDITYTATYNVAAEEHTFSDWTVTIVPTCTESGEETSVCSSCGEEKTRTVEALGHNYENGICTTCGFGLNGPVIVNQPADSEAVLGENYSIAVEALGEGLKYQWYFRNAGSNTFYKSSVKTDTYTNVMTTARAGREVYCVITDANGKTVTSDTVKLIRVAAEELKILSQPVDSEAALDEIYFVSVKAQGEGLKYQWYFRNAGSDKFYKSSVKTDTYTNVMTTARAGREIYCVITDALGNQVTSETTKLIRVASEKLKILEQPTSDEAALDETYLVSVKAQGEGLKYQWYFRNAKSNTFYKSSVKTDTYTSVMTTARAGREIYCVITDALGNQVTSDTVKLIRVASEELKILEQPVSDEAVLGETYSVSVKAQGEGLKYQWYFCNAGSDKFYQSSVKTDTYTNTMTTARANREIYCVITDAVGNQVVSDKVGIILTKYQFGS